MNILDPIMILKVPVNMFASPFWVRSGASKVHDLPRADYYYRHNWTFYLYGCTHSDRAETFLSWTSSINDTDTSVHKSIVTFW